METVLNQAISAVMELAQQKRNQGKWDESMAISDVIVLLCDYISPDSIQITAAYNAGAEEGVRDGGAAYYLETFSKSKEVKQK